MKLLFSFFLIVLLQNSSAQMNFQDSSAQVITYWDLGERYEYDVSLQTLQYSFGDTLKNETITYDVEVSLIDSTKDNYVVRWFYKNFKSDSNDPFLQKLVSVSEDIGINIRLSSLGAIEEVINWQEVSGFISNSLNSLRSEYSDNPRVSEIIDKTVEMYATKASIEATAIQDAQQFHSFHGAKYTLNERLSGEIKTPNIYNVNKPFDTKVEVILEDMDEKNGEYRIRSIQEIDADQLAEATFNYLARMFKDSEEDLPKREEFMKLSNITETVSIIHDSGWVLESVLWKEVGVDNTSNMEIRTIRMK